VPGSRGSIQIIRWEIFRMDPKITTFDKISNVASKIGFGRWKVDLIFYDGKVVGYDEIEKPTESFRENRKNE
jgi:hypothetical protein